MKNAPWRENLDFLQLCFQQISELFPPRQFWRDLLLLDLSKGFLSELAQRCIERFVIFKRLGFHRKRLIIELWLDCVKQTTCCCSHKGWQQNSNRPDSQWCVGHLSHITPYQSYLSCALCILLEQDNTYYKLTVTNAIAWMCASIALSKKFTWCLVQVIHILPLSSCWPQCVTISLMRAMQKVSSVTKKYIVIPRNNVFLTIVQIHDLNFLTNKLKFRSESLIRAK